MAIATTGERKTKRRSSSGCKGEDIKLNKSYSGSKVIIEEIAKLEADEIPVSIEKLRYATQLVNSQNNPSDYFLNTTEYQIFVYNSQGWNKYFEGFINQKNISIDRSLYLSLLKAILKIRKEEYGES